MLHCMNICLVLLNFKKTLRNLAINITRSKSELRARDALLLCDDCYSLCQSRASIKSCHEQSDKSNLFTIRTEIMNMKKKRAGKKTKPPIVVSVKVDDKDIELAFEFFANENGIISPSAMKHFFSVLGKKISIRDLKNFFKGGDNNMCIQDVKCLLEKSNVEEDQVIEAFSILDPLKSGFLSDERLQQIFADLHLGDLTQEELDVITQTLDSDGDGHIGFNDFQTLTMPTDESLVGSQRA